ncbi:MAG: hypothetical protein JXA20_00250 [Spirochaetes bacterium]|nr:hypothetical protein [Spirochaetota bacterium]
MRFVLVLALVVFCLGCLDDDGSADGDIDEVYYENLGTGTMTLLMLGDSRIQMGSWGSHLPYAIINYGRYGATTQGVINRIPRALDTFVCDAVVLHVGANDAAEGHTISLVKNLWIIYRALFASGHPVYVIEVSHSSYDGVNIMFDAINELHRKLCRSFGFTFVEVPDLLDNDGMLKPECTIDGIHWSDAACERVARRLQHAIEHPGMPFP